MTERGPPLAPMQRLEKSLRRLKRLRELSAPAETENLAVRAAERVVILTGTAASEEVRLRATDLAARHAPDSEIRNELKVR